MIGAFGDAKNMNNLNHDGKYYDATDQTALNEAFKDIISDIKRDVKYKDVSITDGITGLTNLTAKTAIVETAADFQYDVIGGSLTKDQRKAELDKVSGSARYDNDTVIWNVGNDYRLIPKVTYSVSFTVWPTQTAYDIIAALNNGTKTWDEVKKDYPNQFERSEKGPNYTYSLLTNTSASVKYKTIETQNGEDRESSDEKTGDIKEKPSMQLTSAEMKVQKVWDDSINKDNRPKSITLKVYRDQDTNPYKTVTLSAPEDPNSNIWESSIYIAPGLIVNGETREDGHDYRLVEEGNDTHYDFETSVVHPMLTVVDNELKIVGLDGGDATLKATNKLRGDIEVRKKVEDSNGYDIGSTNIIKDIPFTFTLTKLSLPEGKAPTNLGADYQKDGAYAVSAQRYNISYDNDGKEIETPDGEQFKLAQEDTFQLKPTQKLRLLNVPIGTTYKIEEQATNGYVLDEKQTVGTEGITAANTEYIATFTNKVKPIEIKFLKARKPGQDDAGKPLEFLDGVKLQITKKVSDTETEVPVVIEDKTDSKGTFEITEAIKTSGMTLSLPDGEYTIKEVKAPDGYQMLTETFTFKVIKGQIDPKAFENAANVSFNKEGNNNIITIFNTPGRVLPGTGGMGTFLYNLSGLALMLTALVYIIHARHRQKGGLN